MIEIKSDVELKKDLDDLIERRAVLLKHLDKLVSMEKEMLDLWRSTKDPVVKPVIHHEIFRMRDTIRCLDWYINRYYTIDIKEIEYILYSSPSINYGNIYEMSNEDILNMVFGEDSYIIGVKL